MESKAIEGWPNMAVRLADWRRVTRVWFCMWLTAHATCPDGQHHLPRSGTNLLLNVHKTPPRHKLRYARKVWSATQVEPCLISGSDKYRQVNLCTLYFLIYERNTEEENKVYVVLIWKIHLSAWKCMGEGGMRYSLCPHSQQASGQ